MLHIMSRAHVQVSNIKSKLGNRFSEDLLLYVVNATGVVAPDAIERDILEVRLWKISDPAVRDVTSIPKL
jgi:hypothetical protein